MSGVERKSTHVEEALANLTAQFSDSTKLRALVQLYVEEVQELEDTFVDLLEQFDVDAAIGASLDVVGAIVGEQRSTRDDTDYRLAIKARILVLKSDGTREDVLGVITALIGLAFTLELMEFSPASFIVHVVEPIDPALINPVQVGNSARAATAAGVGGGVHFHVADPFRYDGPAGSGFDEGAYAAIF
jgi:hypothetical protein